MKGLIGFLILVLVAPVIMQAQPFSFKIQPEKFVALPFGEVTPSGWIRKQMQDDLKGFVGNLDILVPQLMNDPIYSERLHKYSKAKDLGNSKEGDAEGEEQYKWWNSETQSNWWDGYIRNVLLLDDSAGTNKVKQYIQHILSTQDSDGYMGIYDKDLRYHFSTENGELWAKTTLFRGLLAYSEFTGDQSAWNALVTAVDNVMVNYPAYKSNPFYVGKEFAGGAAHGLTFTDVCDRMYQHTNNDKYRQYVLFLYRNYCDNLTSEKDVQLANILNPDYQFQSHGVHTYEHLRPLTVSAYSSDNRELKQALQIYLERIQKATTPSGGPVGDEWIAGRTADATNTGYEYCSLQELTDSYCALLQKSGNSQIAGRIENLFYNAAQGARDPDHSCIAYLKTDNSYDMEGTKNGIPEPGRNQTRYKYSPAHQDVAVCCNPNAGRITPYFVQNMWMKEGDRTLVAALLGPCRIKTTIQKDPVWIDEITEYPYKNHFVFDIMVEQPVKFRLKIRKPSWATKVICTGKFSIEDDLIIIERIFKNHDEIRLEFGTGVIKHQDLNGEYYFTYGALLFAYPLPSREIKGRNYSETSSDYMYSPVEKPQYVLVKNPEAEYTDGKIRVRLKNKDTNRIVWVNLVPIGKTILRQVTFKL
jgi:DUF1680 family protein